MAQIKQPNGPGIAPHKRRSRSTPSASPTPTAGCFPPPRPPTTFGAPPSAPSASPREPFPASTPRLASRPKDSAPETVVDGAGENVAVRSDEQCAERMVPQASGFTGDAECVAEMVEVGVIHGGWRGTWPNRSVRNHSPEPTQAAAVTAAADGTPAHPAGVSGSTCAHFRLLRECRSLSARDPMDPQPPAEPASTTATAN